MNKNSQQSDLSRSTVTVTLAVLLSLNPSLLNSAELENGFWDSSKLLTETTSANKSEFFERVFVLRPEIDAVEQSSTSPYDWERFKRMEKILFVAPAKGGGMNYNLVYTSDLTEDDKQVDMVYLVDPNKPGSKILGAYPPIVSMLRYHDLGDPDKNFYGVITNQTIEKNGYITGHIKREIRVDNATAKRIIDLNGGNTEWKIRHKIDVSTTDNPRIMMPEKY